MEEVLQAGRWSILQAISTGAQSATDIATTTRASFPSISQHLKLLAAYNLITFTQEQKQRVGKPRQRYALKHPFYHISFARQGFAARQTGAPDTYNLFVLNILFLPKKDQPYLHKLFVCNEELLEKCAIAYVKGTEKEIELLLVTDELDNIRNNYSNMEVTYNGKTRKIVAWSHSLAEIEDGLARKDTHFTQLLVKPHVLHDPHNTLTQVIPYE